jgi:hypothetical protein
MNPLQGKVALYNYLSALLIQAFSACLLSIPFLMLETILSYKTKLYINFIKMNLLKICIRMIFYPLPIIFFLLFTDQQAKGQSMGISNTAITPDASSILEMRTTTKGLLIPRLTTTERNAISTPATGLMIYNTTTNTFNFYNGSSWTDIAGGGSGVNSVSGTTNRISIGGTAADPTVDISTAYTGQNSITTLGTIGTGVWNGTAIGTGYGGTGTSTAFTQGSLVFAGASGVYNQNNSKLFWDNTNFRLGIGTASPNTALQVGAIGTGSEHVLIGGTSSPGFMLNTQGSGDLGTFYSEGTNIVGIGFTPTLSVPSRSVFKINKTGAATFGTSVATDDKIILQPYTGGANTFSGTITTADLTAARTYTLPDATGNLALTSDITKTAVGLGNVDNTSDLNKPVSNATQTALNLKLNTSEKGANNGVATLDAGGKVPISQMALGPQVYKGTWDPSTNTPALSDATGLSGDTYRVIADGTVNLGSGNVTFHANDDAIHNGSIWQRNPATYAVTSVNGQSGTVVLNSDQVTEGTTNKYYTDTRANLKIDVAEKGANNGVATLDGGGKVPVSQLPVGSQAYQGTWNASTNTPTLADGTGTGGWTYRVAVAGTQNLGSGNITFSVGDDIIYNGTIWQRSPSAAAVTSVNGQTGVVSLNSDNITEGSTNLYFTNARARTALSANAPLSYNSGSGVFSIPQATSSVSGYLNATDWVTFNQKQAAFSNSAGLASILSDETGSGLAVFSTSPTLVTPVLGVAAATSQTITGTAGAGFLELQSQSSAPSIGPANSVRLFSNAGGLGWKRTDGYVRSFASTLTADRTYTLPDASGTIPVSASGNIALSAAGNLSFTGALPVANGGTNLTSYTTGDLLYASGTTTLSKLAGVATGNALISGGVGAAPSWGKIGLTTHVSGVLPIANGGTNSTATPTAGTVAYGNGTSYQFTSAGTTGQVLTSNAAAAPSWKDGGTMMIGGSTNGKEINNQLRYFPAIGNRDDESIYISAVTGSVLSRSGTLKNFYVRIGYALQAGKVGTVTVYKNGVATALAVTLDVGSLLYFNTTNTISVSAGDEIGIEINTTGKSKFSWAMDFIY